MSVLKEIKLGKEGRDFIRGYLADGKTMSQYLLQYCNFKNGEVVTNLPSDISVEEAKQFSAGGKHRDFQGAVKRILVGGKTWMTMVEKPDTDAHLAGIIRDFLGKGRPICIFEDALSSPTDRWIKSEDERIRIMDDEVYFVLDKRDAIDEEKIARTIRDAYHGWHLVSAMSSLPSKDRLSMKRRNLAKGSMRAIAETAEKIAVLAYDGEGYVVWDKSHRG
jgi:hypothetical protein